MSTVENIFERPTEGHGDADMKKVITDVKAKLFGLNVALQDANQAKKHQSLYD